MTFFLTQDFIGSADIAHLRWKKCNVFIICSIESTQTRSVVSRKSPKKKKKKKEKKRKEKERKKERKKEREKKRTHKGHEHKPHKVFTLKQKAKC